MEAKEEKRPSQDARTTLIISEFIGTLFLVFFSALAMSKADSAYEGFPVATDKVIGVALVHVIVYALFIYASSGKVKCTFNPVISLIRVMRGKWTLVEVVSRHQGLIIIAVQLVASVVAALMFLVIFGSGRPG